MRILFVAMPQSIHTARWLSNISKEGWKIHLFSSVWGSLHPNIEGITYYSFSLRKPKKEQNVRFMLWVAILYYLDKFISLILRRPILFFTEHAFVWIIRIFKPDIIHSLEIQHAGYLTLRIRKMIGKNFPTWIVTNWGSDVYLFGRLDEHREKVRAVLEACDFYSCECKRDVHLAKKLGLRGQPLPVLPNTGGFYLDQILALKSDLPTSSRKVIILKGYQNWAGRALVALQALRMCKELIKDYSLAIFSAGPEIKIAAELFSQDIGIPVHLVVESSHEEILRWHARSRIYVGLSISDAISTSLLEAIIMGAFPIQSCTSCADEWISDGTSGFIVPPEDPYVVADAIRKALIDDALVDHAAEINLQVAKERLDSSNIRPKVIQMYQDIYNARKES